MICDADLPLLNQQVVIVMHLEVEVLFSELFSPTVTFFSFNIHVKRRNNLLSCVSQDVGVLFSLGVNQV